MGEKIFAAVWVTIIFSFLATYTAHLKTFCSEKGSKEYFLWVFVDRVALAINALAIGYLIGKLF